MHKSNVPAVSHRHPGWGSVTQMLTSQALESNSLNVNSSSDPDPDKLLHLSEPVFLMAISR